MSIIYNLSTKGLSSNRYGLIPGLVQFSQKIIGIIGLMFNYKDHFLNNKGN
jgi:hypothetical protein